MNRPNNPVRPPRDAAPPAAGPLRDRELALLTGPVLDLAPRSARLILLAGATGVVLVIVGSLLGNRPTTVAVDKLIHLAGYAVLAAMFVLALRPRLYLPALLGLAALSYLTEIVQPLNTRSFDLGDARYNTIGLAIGAAAGLVVRLAYGYLKTELATARVRRKLIAVEPGATIVREGEVLDSFFIVKSGTVELYREVEGARVPVAQVGPGEMFGLLAEILRVPQPATAVATTAAQVYRVDYDDIIADAGGPQQPVGAVLRALAADLHDAWSAIATLQPGDHDRAKQDARERELQRTARR